MRQSGFSSVLLLVIVVVLGSIGAAGFMMMKDSGVMESIESNSDDKSATTSTAKSSSQEKSNDGAKVTSKSKVKACDILTISKISSITGVPMAYTPDLTADTMNYEDEDVRSSICAFYDPSNVESSAGVSVMLMEALSSEAKAELKATWDETREAGGGVEISGFGDKAYKINSDGYIGANQYYVLVGNFMILASSGIGHSTFSAETMPQYDYTEQTDAVTEEVLRHILPQLK